MPASPSSTVPGPRTGVRKEEYSTPAAELREVASRPFAQEQDVADAVTRQNEITKALTGTEEKPAEGEATGEEEQSGAFQEGVPKSKFGNEEAVLYELMRVDLEALRASGYYENLYEELDRLVEESIRLSNEVYELAFFADSPASSASANRPSAANVSIDSLESALPALLAKSSISDIVMPFANRANPLSANALESPPVAAFESAIGRLHQLLSSSTLSIPQNGQQEHLAASKEEKRAAYEARRAVREAGVSVLRGLENPSGEVKPIITNDAQFDTYLMNSRAGISIS